MALLHRPKLLLLDEPSSGLDPNARRNLWVDLAALRDDEGLTAVVTTHDMEEAERCDRLAILRLGGLVAEGTPEALCAEIGGDVVDVECARPSELAQAVERDLSVTVQTFERHLRVQHPEAPSFVKEVMTRYPEVVRSVRIGRPTLADVFLHRTGHAFSEPVRDSDGATERNAEAP